MSLRNVKKYEDVCGEVDNGRWQEQEYRTLCVSNSRTLCVSNRRERDNEDSFMFRIKQNNNKDSLVR